MKIKNEGVMTGIIYTRVSSDEQVKGTSLDEQLSACQKYCDDKNIKVLEVFREEGESAKSTDRHEFMKAIEYCRKNKADAFVVWKVDRFARNMQDHYAIKGLLLKFGTKLHSVTEQIGEDPTGKLLEGMMAVIAEFDNDIRKVRCSGGMLGLLKKGIWPWSPPMGYLSEHNKKQDKKKERPDQIDPVNFPILQKALKEFAKGMYTMTQFADALTRYGFKPAKKGKIDVKLADRIMARHLRFYAGILDNPFNSEISQTLFKDGEPWYEGKHQAMITKEELYSIVQIKNGKGPKTPKKYTNFTEMFPLKGTLFCHECGHRLTAGTAHGNGGIYNYYYCYNPICSRKNKVINKEEVELDFIKYLKQITPKKNTLKLFQSMVIDHWKKLGRSFNLAEKQYKKELTDLKARQRKVREMRENEEYDGSEYRERMAEIESGLAAATISLNEAKLEQLDIEATITYSINFISNLSRLWFDLPPELKPRFQKLVFPEGVKYDSKTKFQTTKVGLIYKMNQKIEAEKSLILTGVDSRGVGPRTHPCHGCVLPLYYEPNNTL